MSYSNDTFDQAVREPMQRLRERVVPEDKTFREVALSYGVVAVFMLWFLVPVGWLVLSTFKATDIIQADELIIIPAAGNFTLDNYISVLSTGQFQMMFVNSLVIAVATTTLTLTLGIFAAYSLSRFTYPGRHTLMVTFLSTKMLPPVLIIIPFFLMMNAMSLTDSYVGIVLAHSVRALPLSLWLLKGFFDDIPVALDDAARMDGCSHFGVIFRVIVPLALPGIAVAAFYTFVTSWNDFLFVSILSQSAETRTLPYGLYLFRGNNAINWGNTITAATLTAIPSVLIFGLVQNHIVEGLSSGGMHGE